MVVSGSGVFLPSLLCLPLTEAQGLRIVNRSPEPCTTKQGQPCVFPFKFRGVEYSGCTYANSSSPWCATLVSGDSTVVTNRWGDCDISELSFCQLDSNSLPPPTIRPPVTSNPRCVTSGGPDSGKLCNFPFYHNRVYYNACAPPVGGVSSPWCSTRTHPNRTHIAGRGYYGLCPASCPGGKTATETDVDSCSPGSTFRVSCNVCICNPGGRRVCTDLECPSSTTDSPAETCSTIPGSPAGSGIPCIFPFRWAGKTYTSCTPWIYGGPNQGKGWCSTRTDSEGNHVNGQGNLGFCSDSCTNTVGMSPGTRNTKTKTSEDRVVFQAEEEDKDNDIRDFFPVNNNERFAVVPS